MLSRRHFLANTGALVIATEIGMLDFASSLFAAEPKSVGKPVVNVVFVRPHVPPVISWPGGDFDVKAGQALFTKTLTDAARQLGVQLDIKAEPLIDRNTVNAYLEQVKKVPPDGLIVVAMELRQWKDVDHLVQNRGDIPTIVYSNVTAFTNHLQATRNVPKTFVGATHDVGWLAFALRMLNTIWRMKNTRICMVKDSETKERRLDVIGTTLHYIPLSRFDEEFKKVKQSDEVNAMAEFYIKRARKIVEPKKEDILEAAKNYVVCRRLMAAENCQGISVDCLRKPSIYHRPPCMAFSRLLDEGIVAACEADWNAAISMLLTHLLFERPGFMQDPSPNTVNNTLIGAHCMSATKLDGFNKPTRAPFIIRRYHTGTSAALQVLWRIGQKVTVMNFRGPDNIILGTGRVVSNIPQPPCSLCRTAVEIELDGMADSRDTKGFHQLFIYGDLEHQFKAHCKLAGIKVNHI
jgi:hypothetical protein